MNVFQFCAGHRAPWLTFSTATTDWFVAGHQERFPFLAGWANGSSDLQFLTKKARLLPSGTARRLSRLEITADDAIGELKYTLGRT